MQQLSQHRLHMLCTIGAWLEACLFRRSAACQSGGLVAVASGSRHTSVPFRHCYSVCGQAIIRAFRSAGALAVQHVRDAAVSIGGKDPVELRSLLQKCAATSLNSKLVRDALRACARAQSAQALHFTHQSSGTVSVLSLQVSGERDFFAEMVVDAVSALDVETLDMSLLGVKKVSRSRPSP